MVKILIGNMFDSSAQTLVNTVNCVGVMGKGIALEFKNRFPDMFEDYRARCARGEVRLGRPYLYKRTVAPWILNFPTKDHWRSVSRLSDITAGLEHLLQHYRQWGVASLAVPPLGCGLGGLSWQVVGPIIYRYLGQLDVPLEVYAPPGTPEEQLQEEFLNDRVISPKTPANDRLNPAWVALVAILDEIERERYHWPVGRTMFQKIAYFATQLGLPTGLEFERGGYGPFSPQLKPILGKLANNGLLAEQRVGRMLEVRTGPAYGDVAKLYESDLAEWGPTIHRVVDLFVRLNTTQAEIAATVHFVARSLQTHGNGRPSEAAVLQDVAEWKHRRQPAIARDEIALSIRNLNLLGWLDVNLSPDLPVHAEVHLHV